ncbi:MAG: stage II sporulation protein R [Intestinibacillus sp.]
MTKRAKRLELAFALAVLLVFTYAAAAGAQQQSISEKLLRLHVIANSDSAEDQRVKLCVRDKVLALCEPWLAEVQDQAGVRQALNAHMQEIVNAAQEELWAQGSQDSVTAQIRSEYYPTRDYTDFSLPAGRYVGLKLRIGSAKGHNWWCVIFPPLCKGAAAGKAASLSPGEQALTRQDGTRYVVRFKAAELLGELRHAFGAA